MLRKFLLHRLNFLSIFLLISFNSIFLAKEKISPIPNGVSIYQLDNGIQVLLIEKPSLPMTGINTLVKVGSAYENFATSGMSHMLEHLLFNGTTTLTQKELYDATDKIGGYNNANTSEYYTNFMMVTPTENIIEGMKLQAGMLFDSTIPEDKFEKEKGIVLEEIAKSLGNSSEQIERNILSIIYKGHSLSLPTLGTYETIKNMNRNDVYNFYKNYYVPNNMIISVVGNFNSDEMLKNLNEIYGKQKPGTINTVKNSELNSGYEIIPIIINDEKIFHRFYKGEKTQLQLFFNLPNPENLEFFEELNLLLENETENLKSNLNNLFKGDIEGLEFKTREFKIKNHLQATVILNSEKNINAINDTLISFLNSTKFNLTDEIIESEKTKAKTAFQQNIEKPHMFGIYNADHLSQYGIESILNSYSGEGINLAAEEINEFKIDEYPIVIIQHPNSESISEVQNNLQIPILFENSNGAEIIAKQNPGSGLLAIHYLLKNKAAYEEKYGKDAAKILHDIFGQRMKNSEVLNQSLKFGFEFTVNDNPFIPMDNIYLSPEFGYIRVEGLADNIEEAIKFLNDQMLNFIPTQDEFAKVTGKSKMPAMMGHGNPTQKMFEKKVDEILYTEEKYNPSKTELTYENLLEFTKYYFNPNNIIVSVVSKELPENISKYFSEFSKPKLDGAINNSAFEKEFKKISEAINVDENIGGEQSFIYYGFQKNVEPNDKPALEVLSMLISDKIIFDVREKQGMAYRMNAGVEIKNDKAMFNINLGTRPENVEKLIPQLSNFFTEKYLGKITQDEIDKSVNMYLGKVMFRRLSSINQAYYLAHSKYFHNDIFYDSKSIESLKNVKVENINEVVKKYLKVENPIKIIVK
ncbi:MAG: insulinase family protein [Ignavibacteriae bacterium]|nr:insulinase family protein [Ignavibacteriota bacterium]